MEGNIVKQMCAGIDKSVVCVVFITRNYVQKVASDNMSDNCKREFQYTERRLTAKRMISVVMEEYDSGDAARYRQPQNWEGPVGMSLGGNLYIDMSHDTEGDKFGAKLDDLVREILKHTQEVEAGQ